MIFAVAPFAGAWIEIPERVSVEEVLEASLPSRERGLKSANKIEELTGATVAPFAGAWIEMDDLRDMGNCKNGRSLRGSVD